MPRASLRTVRHEALHNQVARRFAKRVMQLLRRRVQAQLGLARRADLHPGVVIVVQRFRSDLGLFVHLHCLFTDGCFIEAGGEPPRFVRLQELNNEDLVGVLAKGYADLEEQIGDYTEEPDEGTVACVELANRERQLGLVSERQMAPPKPKPLTVAAFGMQLHAATTVDGALAPSETQPVASMARTA